MLIAGCSLDQAAPYSQHPSWIARGEDADSRFGFRACYAGDVNGDGYSDLIIGAPGFDHGRGKAYLYLGGPQGLPARPDWTFEGEAPGDALGDRVGSAGDLNGDGFGDVYVTASGWRKGLGKVYVFYGSPGGLARLPSWSAHGEGRPPLSFGDCTVPTGDLNGDGYDDLAIGAYGYDGLRGEVFVYNGSRSGLSPKPGWRAQGEARGDQFGYGLGPAGDLNKDGFDDLVIGSKYHSGAHPQDGKAYLYLGSAKGLGRASWTAEGGSQGANLGTRIYGAGDLDGDGFADILISAPYASGGLGELLAFKGGPQGLDEGPFLRIAAPQGRSAFGYGLGPLGRLGEGLSPAFFVSSRSGQGGVVDLYAVGKDGAHWLQSLRSPRKDDRFGQWCAPAGDLNGDGAADLCVSADVDGPGRVEVYYGISSKAGLKDPDAAKGYMLGNAKKRRAASPTSPPPI
jgi:hypothetical protein